MVTGSGLGLWQKCTGVWHKGDMRIVPRLTLALAATGVLALTIYAAVALSTEEGDLRAAVAREMKLLARSLQVAIENALRDDQARDIAETLTRLEVVEPDVDIAVHDLQGHVRSASSGARTGTAVEDEVVRQALRDNAMVVRFLPEGGLDRLLVATPLRTDEGALIGGLSLGKPLDTLTSDLSRTRLAVLVLVAAFAGSALVVGLALGRWFVGRPLERLLRAMERARGGDLHPGLPMARPDEIGLVAREFSRLLGALEVAQREREREEALRREAERTLEHADKLITVGRLSARFAHEIGSPLQVLVGRAQAITETAGVPDKVARHASLIAEQGHRIVQIVRDLLAWTRPPGAPVPTRVSREVHAITTLLELEAKRRSVALRERIDADEVVVACRPGQLQQVVFNLVKNALAATPEGGDVCVVIAREGAEVVLAVEDTGPGIPPEVLARLFEPFFSTRLDDGGVGLGLTVVRGIVDEHGGKVEVGAREGGGSRFLVRWPIFELGRASGPEGTG